MLLPSLKDDKSHTSVLDQFTGMHSAKFGNGSLRATHQRLVADGRRLTSPLLVSELTSATGTGAALASFQEQIAITLLHRDQDFATVTCLTGIGNAGSNSCMYKSSSPLVGGTQLMFYTKSSSCTDHVGVIDCQNSWTVIRGRKRLVYRTRARTTRARGNH